MSWERANVQKAYSSAELIDFAESHSWENATAGGEALGIARIELFPLLCCASGSCSQSPS
jgi:hypothetical protein